MSEKSQAIIEAERDYQEAECVAQEAIDAQNAAKKRLNLLEMEARCGIRIGDTLEWIVPSWSRSLPGTHKSGVVVDNKYDWPIVQLYKKDGTLGEKRQIVYFPKTSDSTMTITHAPEAPNA